MAAVVHARDRLLADVAALREAHRALDDAGLAGEVLLASCRRRSAGGPRSIRTTSAASALTRLGARRDQRARAAATRPRATSRSMPVSVATATRRRARLGPARARRAGGARRPRGLAGQLPARGPISESIARSAVRSAISTLAPDPVHPQLAQHGLERDRLECRARAPRATTQRSACRRGCGPWDSASPRSSPPRLERGDVVGHLALEELRRVRARVTSMWPRVGALEQAGAPHAARRTARPRSEATGRPWLEWYEGGWSTLRPWPSPRPSRRSSTRSRATGPTSSSTCGSTTSAATSRRP